MKKVLLVVGILVAVAMPAWADWADNFDSYTVGPIVGQGGWKGWDNSNAATGYVSADVSLSAPYSQAVYGASDSVHEYSGYNTGTWVYDAKVFVPGAMTGQPYFILMNQYADGGSNNVWGVQMWFDPNGTIQGNFGSNATVGGVPYVRDQWADIRVEIYLDANWTKVYYNGTEIYDPNVAVNPTLGHGYAWTGGVFGNGTGSANIAAVDLFANNATTIYYDDMSLSPIPEPASLGLIALGILVLRRR